MSFRDNKDRRTLYCGNLHENVTEELLFELFLQSGPLETVRIKRDGRRTFAFVTFKHEESVPYAEVVMENVLLFNRPLRLAARASNKDLNNNANEPYTPEIFVSDNALHRNSPSWHPSQQQQQQGNAFMNQQSLPIPIFSSNNNEGFNSNNNNYPPQTPFYAEDRTGPRFDRRKQHSYHPYNRNDQQHQQQAPYQEYQSMKQQQRGGYQQRRGGGSGGGYNNNYYR